MVCIKGNGERVREQGSSESEIMELELEKSSVTAKDEDMPNEKTKQRLPSGGLATLPFILGLSLLLH